MSPIDVKRDCGGYTLFGVLIVIAVGAIILGATAALSMHARRSNRVQSLVFEVTQIRDGMHALYGSGSGLYTAGVSAFGSALQSYVGPAYASGGWLIYTPFSRATSRIYVQSASWGGAGSVVGDAYQIVISGVPAEACISAARSLVGVGDVVLIDGTEVRHIHAFHFKTAAAAAACSGDGSHTITLRNT